MSEMYNPPHPGEILADTVLRPDGGISITEFAKHLGVTRVALSRVVNGRAGVSADMDLRLSKALGSTPGTWYKNEPQGCRRCVACRWRFRMRLNGN